MVQGRWRVAVLAAVAAVVLAACAKSSSTTSGGGSPAGSAGGGGKIGTAKISGVGTVLEDPQGLTLYHLTTEKNGQFQCTGSCTSTWPPYLAPGGAAPAGASSLTGPIATITRPDGGVHVTYNGFPLYTYSGDSGPGQATGNGVSNVWYAVTPTGDASSSGGSSGGRYGSGGSGGGGGGYGYGGS